MVSGPNDVQRLPGDRNAGVWKTKWETLIWGAGDDDSGLRAATDVNCQAGNDLTHNGGARSNGGIDVEKLLIHT